MTSDARVMQMQHRIQRWLRPSGALGEHEVEGTLAGLDEDIKALEAELRTLFPDKESTQNGFETLRDQAMFRTVLESVVEGVIVADLEGRFLIFNTAARNLLGEGPTEGSPDEWSERYGLFYPDGKTLYPSQNLPLSRALMGETVDGEQLVIRTPKHPDNIHILATAKPLFASDNSLMGGVVVFHDITESKMVEEELRRARQHAEDASRTKSEFIANMSHEIRTPLTAVLGFADLLMDSQLNESAKLNYIQAVRRNGEHLLALINDVLDISKIQANKMHVERHVCSLHQLMHETASIMQVRAHEKGLDFDVVYETPIPMRIESDAMRVRQILLNLLSNAIKFTRGGRVTLTARCVDVGTESSRIELAVSDTGIGLSDEEREELFHPFQQASPSTTREYGGTGLGLAICKSLAEALGGAISTTSVPGHGSTFTFALYHPIDEQTKMVTEHDLCAEELQDGANTSTVNQSLSGRILLAEDGVDNQLLVSTILRRQGLSVDIAENGQVAVTEAMEAMEAGAPYDLILMDMQMPKLDGYGATAKLRSKGYSGPILALTAHAMRGERARCIQAGCNDYLTKPIARTLLLASVECHLNRARGGYVGTSLSQPTAVGNPDGDSDEVLYSFYADDPDMDELIAGFVERLPGQVKAIRSAAEQADFDALRRLAHQIKGAAGGYGFMSVSEQAAALEEVAKTANAFNEIKEAVDRFASLCGRIRYQPDAEDRKS